nr:ubiquitin-conjugating enzyme E2 R2-like [Ciona intestinalis]|eukprot:XP_002127319.1 ubiquitin-conjugating enzyme E2 R2-like [Ciona intestinalis]
MATMSSSASKILQSEFKKLQQQPVEGFKIALEDDSDIFKWKVGLYGPPETLYAGGYFRAIIKFPQDYPYSPPTFKFITKMFHSNIYENGEVCISILHSPVNDPQSGELPSERWNPTQTVRTILLSVISLLNEPNTYSPANVDASVMYRRWKNSKGCDKEYEDIIRKQVQDSRKDAEREGVVVPMTVSEYCIKTRLPSKDSTASNDITDIFFDDDDGDDDYGMNEDYEYDDDDDNEDYGDDDSGAHDEN